MEGYLAIKKNKLLPFVITWMDLEGTMPNKTNETKTDKYHTISLICGVIMKKNKAYFKKPQNRRNTFTKSDYSAFGKELL